MSRVREEHYADTSVAQAELLIICLIDVSQVHTGNSKVGRLHGEDRVALDTVF